jgi:hypothetical protein
LAASAGASRVVRLKSRSTLYARISKNQ